MNVRNAPTKAGGYAVGVGGWGGGDGERILSLGAGATRSLPIGATSIRRVPGSTHRKANAIDLNHPSMPRRNSKGIIERCGRGDYVTIEIFVVLLILSYLTD